MTDNDWRNARIEEAAKAMANAPHAGGWNALVEGERDWYLADAAVALAVFEKAHTPTGDEREALPRALWENPINVITLDELNARADSNELDYAETRDYLYLQVDAALPLLRRSEVPEPSTECPQPCVHLSQHDAREGRTCAEHPCTCPEPQGEPSDAEVNAALHEYLRYSTGGKLRAMRMALRAAGGVR